MQNYKDFNHRFYIVALQYWGMTEEQSAVLQIQTLVRAGQATFSFKS